MSVASKCLSLCYILLSMLLFYPLLLGFRAIKLSATCGTIVLKLFINLRLRNVFAALSLNVNCYAPKKGGDKTPMNSGLRPARPGCALRTPVYECKRPFFQLQESKKGL